MEWLIQFGYLGLFIGAFVAGSVVPMSSDVLIVGLLALGGNKWICLIAASLGNWLGGYTSYWIGWLAKWDKLEKWFGVNQEKLEKQKKKIDKFGLLLAFFSWAPFVGAVFIIGLGFYRIRPKATCLFILIGCVARFLFWVILYIIFADQFINWITK